MNTLDCDIFWFSGSPNQFSKIVIVGRPYCSDFSEWRDWSSVKTGAKGLYFLQQFVKPDLSPVGRARNLVYGVPQPGDTQLCSHGKTGSLGTVCSVGSLVALGVVKKLGNQNQKTSFCRQRITYPKHDHVTRVTTWLPNSAQHSVGQADLFAGALGSVPCPL